MLDVFQELLPGFEGERIGLTIFNSSPVQIFPLTDDYDFIETHLTDMRDSFDFVESVPEHWVGTLNGPGGSLIGDGLAACALGFDRPEDDRSRSIIFATDNEINGAETVTLQQGADFYASLRTSAALEKAEVAVVVLDVSQSLSEQDVRIIDLVLESGRALVLAFNKWDLLNTPELENQDRRRYLEREIEQDLAHVAWAPRVNISARTGRHLDKLVPALETALESWDQRIPTGKFNAFLAELVAEHPHPLRGGKQPRILFGTQASTRPPTFVLFTTGFLDPGYRRFIQRRLREIFGFEGTPIVTNMRVRERRQR